MSEKQQNPFDLGNSIANEESTRRWRSVFPRVRATFSPNTSGLAPDVVETINGNPLLKENTTDEVEESYSLNAEQLEYAKVVLEKQNAREFPLIILDATWYDLRSICSSVPKDKQELCKNLEVRVRSKTYAEYGFTEYYWTVKIKGDPKGLRKPETEQKAKTPEEALKRLEEAVQSILKLPEKPKIETPGIRIRKTRMSYKYREREQDPLPCTGSQIDFDLWTVAGSAASGIPYAEVNMEEGAFITLDIEGPSEEHIARCRNCLQGYIAKNGKKGSSDWKEWKMEEALKGFGLPDPKG